MAPCVCVFLPLLTRDSDVLGGVVPDHPAQRFGACYRGHSARKRCGLTAQATIYDGKIVNVSAALPDFPSKPNFVRMARPSSPEITRPQIAHVHDDSHIIPAASALTYTTFPFPISAADQAAPPPVSATIDQEERASRSDSTTPSGTSLFRARVRSHPRPFFILGGLILLMVVDVVGLMLYMMKVPGANEGFMTIINAIFVLA